MSDYELGMTLKTNMMAGRPTQTKSRSDYPGWSIPPCGNYAMKEASKVPRPPWLPAVVSSKSMSLHEEIITFMRYMEPTLQEVRMRVDLVRRFTKLIASFNMNASVQPVGSYVTGLYLPTSDIDMVLTFQPENRSDFSYLSYSITIRLSTLIGKIRNSGFASEVVDVLRASVPLIRITDKITGIEIDLTASDTHAVKATQAVQKWLQLCPLAKPLLFVVKMFLSIRRCGTTYTGGINSYTLFWMVIAWVKLEMPEKKQVTSSANDLSSLLAAFGGLSVSRNVTTSPSSSEGVDLGKSLINFLKFYAEEFDCYTNAIKIEPTPAYCTKRYGYSRYRITQRYMLSIYDPANESIDMGSKAYGIKHIRESFKSAYLDLADMEAEQKSGRSVGKVGVLGRMLGGDYTKFLEKRNLAVAEFLNVEVVVR